MLTLLVANRGEIARRIFRTAKRIQLRTVAVYSDVDAEAPFTREADEAIRIGPPPPAESYLHIQRILDAAKETEADLIHPGYGFLAESDEFAEACATAGFTFVGPTPEVLRLMGAKDQAKRIALEAGVPVLDTYFGEDQSDRSFLAAAEEIGYPVMVKPAEGGGGKGMAVAHTPYQLEEALVSARRISKAAFGDERLLIERYLERAHHVEVQIFGDSHDNVVHLGERDCSLQRRHQKIMEESPSPNVDDRTRELLCDSAVRLARHVGYLNAGTCEFIVGDDGAASFIELNARLQVEHPVTEFITGLDLVELQLRIAQGEAIWFSQDEVRRRGHAIEARIYAEDPDNDFLPQAGRILHIAWPAGDIRVDSGIEEGTAVPAHYDPLLVKVIVHGENRAAALSELRRALDETKILGVRTNLPFLKEILDRPEVDEGRITTTWLETFDRSPYEVQPTPQPVITLAAAAEIERLAAAPTRDPWNSLMGWRPGGSVSVSVDLVVDGEDVRVAVGDQIDTRGAAAFDDGVWYIWWEGRQYEIPLGHRPRNVGESEFAHLEAPMPGQVIAVKVENGDSVVKNQELVVVEAMKMEHTIRAPAEGIIEVVFCAVGQQVQRGQTLVDFRPAGAEQ